MAATTETDLEVDSKKAKLRSVPAREQIPDKPPWKDPQVPKEWVYAAQLAIDNGEIVIGGVGTKAKCPGREVINGIEVECPHHVFAKSVEVRACTDSAGDNHEHRKAKEFMCLIHWVRYLAANLAPAGNGPLFAE